jgi:hypothetical protein
MPRVRACLLKSFIAAATLLPRISWFMLRMAAPAVFMASAMLFVAFMVVILLSSASKLHFEVSKRFTAWFWRIIVFMWMRARFTLPFFSSSDTFPSIIVTLRFKRMISRSISETHLPAVGQRRKGDKPGRG